MAAIAAPATNAAISAYSIAVAALRSARSLFPIDVNIARISRRGIFADSSGNYAIPPQSAERLSARYLFMIRRKPSQIRVELHTIGPGDDNNTHFKQ